MTVIFFIFILFAMWFIFIQGIHLPTYRHLQRVKIFAIRDRLRKLHLENNYSAEAIEITEGVVNNSLKLLPSITIFKMYLIHREVKGKPEMFTKAKERVKIIDDCENEELHKLLNESSDILAHAAITNMAGWLPIILAFVPLLLVAALISKGIRNLRIRIEEESEVITALPDSYVSGISIL